MAKINIDKTRKALQSFDFKTLFIEELGWSNPVSTKTVNETIKENTISRKPIAELAGAVVFEISASDGSIPEPKQRAVIAKEIQKLHYENVLIFLDKEADSSTAFIAVRPSPFAFLIICSTAGFSNICFG